MIGTKPRRAASRCVDSESPAIQIGGTGPPGGRVLMQVSGRAVEVTVEREGLVRIGPVHEREELLQLCLGLAEIGVEAIELVGLIAAAQPQQRTVAAERLGHADLGEEPDGMVERHHDHRRPELDALGEACAVIDHQQRRGADAVVGEVVLRETRRASNPASSAHCTICTALPSTSETGLPDPDSP